MSEPDAITDPDLYDNGYIWIPNWDKHQHPDTVKRGNSMAWHKTLTMQLDDDDYLSLPRAARGLLVDVRMLVARAGNGRPKASVKNLSRQLGVEDKHLRIHRDLIVAKGFLAVVSRRRPVGVLTTSSLEEKREETRPSKVLSPSLVVGGVSSAGVEAPPPKPRTSQNSNPSTTELDDGLAPLRPHPQDLPGQRRDAAGFLY